MFTVDIVEKLKGILELADELNLNLVKIQFKNDDVNDFIRVVENREDFYKWKISQGYKDEAMDSFCRHVFFSLLSDILEFIISSLSAITHDKVSVAFSLLS